MSHKSRSFVRHVYFDLTAKNKETDAVQAVLWGAVDAESYYNNTLLDYIF